MNDDFILDCEQRGDSDIWDFTCRVTANSTKAKEKFGDCEIGQIILMYDEYTLQFLKEKYDIDDKRTIILDMLYRNKNCDKHNELKGIVGFSMLCSLLDEDIFRNFDYIFLIALSKELINYYKKFGFLSLSPEKPEQMIALIMDVKQQCSSQKRIPTKSVLRRMDTE